MVTKRREPNLPSHVDLAGDRGSAEVQPVDVVGGELLGASSLDERRPLGDLELAALLEVRSECLDEVLGRDVLDGHADFRVQLRNFRFHDAGDFFFYF